MVQDFSIKLGDGSLYHHDRYETVMIDTNHRPDPQANDNIRPKLAPDVSAAMAVMQARIGFKYGDLDLFRRALRPKWQGLGACCVTAGA